MVEYKLLENYPSIRQNVERLNEMAVYGWRVHTFTDLLTLMVIDIPTEIPQQLNEG